MTFFERHKVRRVVNALGTSTIVGANIAPPEVIAAAAEALGASCEIDELQRAACRAIAEATGAEAGCVTSSAASGIAIAAAACMTGADLSKIARLPDTDGLANEVVLQHAHDVNFGAPISQMIRGAVSSPDDLLSLEQSVAIAGAAGVPVIVDAAAESDVRPFLRVGAAIVIASGHKAMGAPTSGLLCGRQALIRACYLQNWGIGRAMKVGKEGIAGLIAAVERWYGSSPRGEYGEVTAALAAGLVVEATSTPHRVRIRVVREARQIANLLREGDPPIWINSADDRTLVLDLRNLTPADAKLVAGRIESAGNSNDAPREDVPYHDLYWSEARLLRWPD